MDSIGTVWSVGNSTVCLSVAHSSMFVLKNQISCCDLQLSNYDTRLLRLEV